MILKRRFSKECNCEACVNDYAILSKLPLKDLLPPETKNSMYEIFGDTKFDKTSQMTALRLRDVICTYLNDLDEHYPSKDLVLLQYSLSICINILQLEKPYSVIFAPKSQQ